jgi:hypothetical protein
MEAQLEKQDELNVRRLVLMPVEVGIWRINDKPEKVHFSPIENEMKLEDTLYGDVSILDPDLMVIGRQVPTAYGTFIDLLAIDADGNLTIIELKKNRTPREVVAQVLDYASWVQDLAYEQITTLYADTHPGEHFEQAFSERFDTDPPESLNEEHRLIVVASELDNITERIIGYLSTNYGVPINAVFFRHFKEGDNEYLTRTWLIDPNQAEAQASKAPSVTKGGKEPWNGKDYYVSLLENHRRTWEDCVTYGFVSAGGGRWYSRTLNQLTPGVRVFVHIPQNGYVVVGTVKETVVPVKDFQVIVDGNEVPILQSPKKAENMGEDADDPERSEYLVRVAWDKVLPARDAYWVTGMYANQNSVTKLRNKFTLDRLAERFDLENT